MGHAYGQPTIDALRKAGLAAGGVNAGPRAKLRTILAVSTIELTKNGG
jgi:hypothetical protein